MKKVYGSIATVMVLLGSVISAGKAEAITTFTFTDFRIQGGPVSAEGFFVIDDINDDGEVDFTTELVNYGVTLSSTELAFPDDITITPANDNSTFRSLAGVTINTFPLGSSQLDFTTSTGGFLCFSSFSGNCTFDPNEVGGRFNLGTGSFNDTIISNGSALSTSSEPVPSSTDPAPAPNLIATAVPFEFSPTLGILAMGGILGGSRLRKARKAACQLDNDKSA